MKLTLIFLTLLTTVASDASEGFQPSRERNVVMLKSQTSGGTAFIFRDSLGEPLIITQQHVIEGHEFMILQWGHNVGPLFRLEAVENGAYQFPLSIRPIWQDSALDVAILKAPEELLQRCECNGLEGALFRTGPATLIGYPIVQRRIWPSTSDWLWKWRELWGDVTQQVSVGSVWKEGEEYLGDMDSISGNSGGPVLQDGKVIGVIHLLKTWKGEGYRYKNPSLNFIPLETVFAEFSKSGNKLQ